MLDNQRWDPREGKYSILFGFCDDIDGSGSIRFIADRLLLFDKSSDDGIPNDGDIKVQKDN